MENKMKLESLANESILYIFQFLNTIDLLRAFYDINCRFNGLLLNHSQKYCFNLQHISKSDFELACHQYIPLIIDRIMSIHLSDDDDTPQQSILFLRQFSTLQQFSSLRSLSFYRLRSNEQVKKMISACRYVPNLTHLSLIKCSFLYNENNSRDLLNILWSLPNLTHCRLITYLGDCSYLYAPTIMSSSLRNLCIKGFDYTGVELMHLIEHTPCLKYLDLHIEKLSRNQHFSSVVSSIITLKIIIGKASNWLKIALQNMPNLQSLTVRTLNKELDGYQWEEIIDNHLPKLKRFRLLMRFKTDSRDNKETIVDTLFDSFLTPFWLEKHQWFIRVNWNPSKNYSSISLYTLPYAFEDYDIRTAVLSKSTCFVQNENDWSYNRVTWLIYDCSQLGNLHFNHYIFPNISYLSLILPFNQQFWSIIPRFDQLRTLDVSLYNPHSCDTDIRSQLQALLDRATRLHSLRTRSSPDLSECIYKITSLSVRRLHFISNYQFSNESELLKLIHSSLGMQCEVLQIGIEKRLNIPKLVNEMINLRAIKFIHPSFGCNCFIHDWFLGDDDDDNEFILWSSKRLSFSLVVTLSSGFFSKVRIWIR